MHEISNSWHLFHLDCISKLSVSGHRELGFVGLSETMSSRVYLKENVDNVDKVVGLQCEASKCQVDYIIYYYSVLG